MYSLQAPFSFQLSLLSPSASSPSPAFRRLLDIEKLTFATDATGCALHSGGSTAAVEAETVVQVSVNWFGRAPSLEAEAALRTAGVEFNLVCETLLAPVCRGSYPRCSPCWP